MLVRYFCRLHSFPDMSQSRSSVWLIIRPILCVLIGALVSGCIDAVNLGLDAPDPRPVVVDGSILSGPGPHAVTLSRAAAFEQSLEGADVRIRKARVFIRNLSTGEETRLSESVAGRYETEPGALIGRPGERYRLDVRLNNGAHYRSIPEVMPGAVPLDSLYTQYDPSRDVFTVRADYSDPAGEPRRYRWDTEALYQYVLPGLAPSYCWIDDGVGSDLPLTDDRLTDGQDVQGMRIRSIPNGRKTILAYQVNVRQLTLTPEAYEFWKIIETQVENIGDPFTPPPTPVPTNIRAMQKTGAKPRGYFAAVGASSQHTVCVRTGDDPRAPRFQVPETDLRCNGPTATSRPPDFWTCTVTVNPSP